ncbi:hypothetical protein QBC40DRAFT_174280 [Triangularia verruculosa]|uniref:Uncharacterized protein n=1 Tax=Triangularia verruculosa TaxID=2587418 RepID=A0AAN6XM66_9PEZI|nr:hypothetical protein QBC40DRAFT_174280 [Triangularia verruculosa]
MSADTVSTLFAGRPIRPLPKRPLRERLSAEAASSIQYPRVPQTVPPPFTYPCPPTGANTSQVTGEPSQQSRTGSDADDPALRRANRAPLDSSGRLSRPVVKTDIGRHGMSYPPTSASSSADGYDSLEHTNNKKKRKIPSAADMMPNGQHHTIESLPGVGSHSLGVQPLDGQDGTSPGCTTYYGPGYRGIYGMYNMYNVAGPGRGRYGRPRSGRSPLRPLPDTTNSWAGRNGKARPVQWASVTTENTGIISNAIANAEKLAPHQGQENISLLEQQLNTKRTPATSQFTFTCASAVTAWPGRVLPPQQSMNIRYPMDNTSRGVQVPQTAYAPPAQTQPADALPKDTTSKSGVNNHAQPLPKSKPARRSAAKEYLAAARARRRAKQEENRRHPPKPEDIWICHFCEYEDIFGRPPEALIRQYEMKDRKQRQLEQQRRAQWERMKKGKHKGKKNSKLPNKNNNAVQDAPAADSLGPSYSQGTQSEEYYDDEEEYEDEEYEGEEDGYPDSPVEVPDRHQQFPVRPGNHAIPGT